MVERRDRASSVRFFDLLGRGLDLDVVTVLTAPGGVLLGMLGLARAVETASLRRVRTKRDGFVANRPRVCAARFDPRARILAEAVRIAIGAGPPLDWHSNLILAAVSGILGFWGRSAWVLGGVSR